ncbi:hypothetical protein AMTRI_Chr04g244650 [Amborella trichopoda]
MILWDPATPCRIGPLRITIRFTSQSWDQKWSFASQKFSLSCCSQSLTKRDDVAKNNSFSLARSQGLKERLKNKKQGFMLMERYTEIYRVLTVLVKA